jgi:hypothetical protein
MPGEIYVDSNSPVVDLYHFLFVPFCGDALPGTLATSWGRALVYGLLVAGHVGGGGRGLGEGV